MKKCFEEWPERTSDRFKRDQKDLLIAEDMTRREFLRAGVGLAAFISGI